MRPHLEYASPVWSPHTAHDIVKLENVQKFALRMISWCMTGQLTTMTCWLSFVYHLLRGEGLNWDFPIFIKIVNNLCYFPPGLIQFRSHHYYNTRSRTTHSLSSSLCLFLSYELLPLLTLGTKGYGSRFVVRSFTRSFILLPRYREQRSLLRAR